ncbi:MAG: threonylcarbamoyl-AMP synthase [Anaerolineales bacterium]|nr:threonylcarbamoyl-AMP synthase [Anaerolineales bacterium]
MRQTMLHIPQQTELWDAIMPEAITRTATLLQQGQLVVFPTDTVYGVGAHAFQAEAIARLYTAKIRSFEKGIPILLADLADLEKVSLSLPDIAQTYIEQFWPGPLTLVVRKRPTLPDNLSPNENIAVRIPDNAVARALIRAVGGAVAATSANISGQPPAQTAKQAFDALQDTVAVVLDGGPAPQGQASTVVDCTQNPPRILRPGPITANDLAL